MLWNLNFIAVEIEHPFGHDANDLDSKVMQEHFNKQLILLSSDEAWRLPTLSEDLTRELPHLASRRFSGIQHHPLNSTLSNIRKSSVRRILLSDLMNPDPSILRSGSTFTDLGSNRSTHRSASAESLGMAFTATPSQRSVPADPWATSPSVNSRSIADFWQGNSRTPSDFWSMLSRSDTACESIPEEPREEIGIVRSSTPDESYTSEGSDSPQRSVGSNSPERSEGSNSPKRIPTEALPPELVLQVRRRPSTPRSDAKMGRSGDERHFGNSYARGNDTASHANKLDNDVLGRSHVASGKADV